MKATQELLRFGVFELNLEVEELRKGGTIIKLPPQPFELLVLLASHAGQIVTRSEIQEQLWGQDTFVDFEQGVNKCIKQIRAALNDPADQPLYIETLPRHGYRFLAPVTSKTVSTPSPQVKESSSGLRSDVLPQVLARVPAVFAAPPVEGLQPIPTKTATAPALDTAPIREPIRRVGRPYIGWAVMTLVALIAGGLYWHLKKATPLTEKDVIVLAEFDNKTGDTIFDGTLRQALAIQLEQSPFLNLISDARIGHTIALMAKPKDTRVTREVAREVCQRTGSAATIEGSISTLGSQYVLGLEAVNCRNGDLLAEEQVTANSKEQVLKALSEAATRMRKKLGESLASVDKFNKPLAEATTSSLDALQAFTAARSMQREKGDAASISLAKHALELDPDFAQGYATLGVLYRNLDQPTLAVDNFKKAYELRARTTQRERFFIEASYYSFATGDLEKANETYRQWTETYPRDVSAHLNLAVNYSRLGQYNNYLEQTQEARRLTSDNANVYANLMESYLALNRLDEAKVAFDEARVHNLDSQHLRANRYIVAFLQGDMAGMQEQLTTAMGKPGFEDKLLEAQSDTEAYYGRFTQARQFSQQAVDSAAHASATETAAEYRANAALREAEVGNSIVARNMAMEALLGMPGRDVESLAALALARAGDVAQARILADRLSQQYPQDTIMQSYTLPTIRAAISLAGNRPEKVIPILRVAAPYERSGSSFSCLYPAYLRGIAYLEAGQGQNASVELQKLLEQRGIVQNFIVGALAHLQVARAEVMSGDKAAARKEYAAFLALWKGADTDMSILKEAKAEYAKLQ